MLLPNSALENHPDGTGDLNAIVHANWGTIERMFNPAAGLTLSQTALIVTASAALFAAHNVGDSIVWLSGAGATITAYTNPTTVTVSVSQTVAAGAAWLYHDSPTSYTALARGLLKTPTIQLAQGDTIMWDATKNRFVTATGYYGAKAGCIFTATASAVVTNTAVETSLAPTGTGSLVFPANFLTVGRTICVNARGFIATTGLAGNFRQRLTMGAGPTTIVDSGLATMTNGLANSFWETNFKFTVRSIGATGTIIGQGYFLIVPSLGASPYYYPLVNTAAVTLDTTVSNTLDIKATWGTVTAANSIRLTNMDVTILN